MRGMALPCRATRTGGTASGTSASAMLVSLLLVLACVPVSAVGRACGMETTVPATAAGREGLLGGALSLPVAVMAVAEAGEA